MSDSEKTFIRQLKITLISVLGPFMLIMLGSMINDHYKIKDNKEHIEVVESAMVDQKLFFQYIDELRNLNKALEKDIDNYCAETGDQMTYINNRIDILVREIYKHSTRGVPAELKQ